MLARYLALRCPEYSRVAEGAYDLAHEIRPCINCMVTWLRKMILGTSKCSPYRRPGSSCYESIPAGIYELPPNRARLATRWGAS